MSLAHAFDNQISNDEPSALLTNGPFLLPVQTPRYDVQKRHRGPASWYMYQAGWFENRLSRGGGYTMHPSLTPRTRLNHVQMLTALITSPPLPARCHRSAPQASAREQGSATQHQGTCLGHAASCSEPTRLLSCLRREKVCSNHHLNLGSLPLGQHIQTSNTPLFQTPRSEYCHGGARGRHAVSAVPCPAKYRNVAGQPS